MEDVEESTGESWPPEPVPSRSFSGCGGDEAAVRDEIYLRLKEGVHGEAASDPEFRARLDAHLSRLPTRYLIDVMDRVDDVLLHEQILSKCEESNNCPVFHIRYLKSISELIDGEEDSLESKRNGFTSCLTEDHNCEVEARNYPREMNMKVYDEPSLPLEELNLKGKKVKHMENGSSPMEAISSRKDTRIVFLHEIIFSSLDKPKLLAKLTSLLSEIGLNIREAHVFSTTDGYCLDAFVVDGWPSEEVTILLQELRKRSTGKYACLSDSQHSARSRDITELQDKVGNLQIDWGLLDVGEKIASGSSGDLYYGSYQGNEVAIKVFKSEHLRNSVESEFVQEVMILRRVDHPNVIHFYGACTKPPDYCIVTEYMHGGSLFDFLHKQNNKLKLLEVLRVAIDVSKAMEYLHQNNIIHRDLKTANLLMDSDGNVKVADFGVARFQSSNGDMTAETGTYRWMAPEVIKHQQYDEKADVFSFSIVLLELATSEIPYGQMTPLQVALGVREGMRPEIPRNVNSRLSKLIRKCWETNPSQRPTFSDIVTELHNFSQEFKGNVRCKARRI